MHPPHPPPNFSSYSNITFRLQLTANSSATSELLYSLPVTGSIRLLAAFGTGPATTFFRGRTFPSGQTKCTCNTTALRRISVDVSPSISVDVVELVVKVRIFGHPVLHNLHPLIYSCGVSVKELVCQENLRTADGVSRRAHHGRCCYCAEESKANGKHANQVGSNMKSMNYVLRATAKIPFPRSIFSNAALSSDANNRNSCLLVHEQQSRSLFPFFLSSISTSGTKPPLPVAGPRLAALRVEAS